jgi:putative transposase
MPRTARFAPGDVIYHVLNRAVGRTTPFRARRDYLAFQHCLIETLDELDARLLGYCIMPNHWHLLLWPRRNGDLGRFMMRLSNRHVRRWLTSHDQVGSGHLYQGRYKSFACQDDDHLATVARYIERNPLRAKLVTRAQLWPWSSLGQSQLDAQDQVPLSEWPVARRDDWTAWVNAAQTASEVDAIRKSVVEQRPYGSRQWVARSMGRLGWREPGKPGRPRKQKG